MKLTDKKVILLDLDGTISDPGLGIAGAARHALSSLGIEENDPERLRSLIGPPLSESFRKFYGMDEDTIAAATRTFREYYAEHGLYENTIYPGAAELLRRLHSAGRILLLATSKPEPFARHIVESFGLTEYFTFVGGSCMDETRTDKDLVIEYCLENAGITDRSSCIMVGDRRHDVEGARKQNIDCIGVLYGYGGLEELEGAGTIAIAEDIDVLGKLLLGE